jgi:PAS domain-containing protein
VSKGQAARFRVTPDEVIGKTDLDFFSAEHATRPTRRGGDRAYRRADGPTGGEAHLAGPPDEWVSFSKYPLRDDDGASSAPRHLPRRHLARASREDARRHTTADIEQLVSVEFELRMVLDRSPDAVVKLDRDMRHVYVKRRLPRRSVSHPTTSRRTKPRVAVGGRHSGTTTVGRVLGTASRQRSRRVVIR